MTQPEQQEAPDQGDVVVVNLVAPDEDSTASMGALEPIEFVGGRATMSADQARELHHASPAFVLEEDYEAMKAAEAEAEVTAPPDPEPEPQSPVEPEPEEDPETGV